MSILVSYGNIVDSVFSLIGNKENDITMSISWALSQCPVFMDNLVKRICHEALNLNDVTIYNQQWEENHGVTDIEITDQKQFHIVIEAKRGWIIPDREQLEKYSQKECFTKTLYSHKHIVTLSECSEDYVNVYKSYAENNTLNGVKVSHISYKEIYKMAEISYHQSSNKEKNLLKELINYLKGLMTMQNKDSNWVYVVSLKDSCPEGCSLTYIDIVNKCHKYYCPIGGGWPKEPPNYIAFRYYGKLQSIHHIEDYTIERNMHLVINEMPDCQWDRDHFVYELGPAIIPPKTIKTGNLYRNVRVYAMFDTLLTCDTISEARAISLKR